MSDRIVESYLKEVRRHLKDLPASEQDALIAEMRIHLAEDIQRRRQTDPTLADDVASLRATHDFGDPAEIGAAHAVRRGASVLTPDARPKRSRRWMVFPAVGVVGLILIGMGISAYQDDVSMGHYHYVPPLYERSNEYAKQTSEENDSFMIGPDVSAFRLYVSIYAADNNTGCGGFELTSPSKLTVMDNQNNCGEDRRQMKLQGEGVWKLHFKFKNFTGSVRVEVYALDEPDPSAS